MLRKVSNLSWHNLSLLKLREELSSRGLPRLSSKEEMIKKLEDYEKQREMLSSLTRSSLTTETESLNNLPANILFEEILKRDPDFFLSEAHSKASLLETLKTILIEERGSGGKDLRYLIKHSLSGEPLSVKEILSVFSLIQDPLCMSQMDFNILIHTESDSLCKIWETIVNEVSSLDFVQVKLAIEALNTLQNYFQKDFLPHEPRISSKNLNVFLAQAFSQSDQGSASQISSLLIAADALNKEKDLDLIQRLREKMIEKFDINQFCNDSSLFKIIINLPKGCEKSQSEKIDKMIEGMNDFYSSLTNEQLIHLVFGVHRSGRKIPFDFSQYLDTLLFEGLKKIPLNDLIELRDILLEHELMSETLGSNICEAFSNLVAYEQGNSEEIINFIYKFHEKGLSNLVIGRFRPFVKIYNMEGELPLKDALKFGIFYMPHAIEPNSMIKVLLSIVKNQENTQEILENFELISTLQKNLLDIEKPRPIFNYQFNSFENLNIDVRDRCIHGLNSMIQSHQPKNPLIFEYFSEYNNAKEPTSEYILGKSSIENFNKLCKTIWRFNLNHLVLDVLKESLEFLSTSDSDFTEGLYYLSSLNPEISNQIDPKWSKPGVFQPALNYNLSLPVKIEPNTLELLTENLVLFGEPLLKTLIILSQSNKNLNIFRLSSSLCFTPSTHPFPSADLILRFFNEMQVHESPVDSFACSSFLSSNIEKLKTDNLTPLFNFFKNDWSVTRPELQNFFETHLKSENLFEVLGRGLNPSSIPKVMKMNKNAEVSVKNSEIIERMAKYHVYDEKIINDYANLAKKLEPDESLVLVTKLLQLFSITSCSKNNFEVLCEAITKTDIWEKLTFDDCINFFINYHQFKDININIPSKFEEKFKYNLIKIDNSDVLTEHPVVKALNYSPFKYMTEFEPRFLVSNNQILREMPAEVNFEIGIPENLMFKYLKKYALLEYYKVPPYEEITRVLNNYYKMREKNIIIKTIRSELIEIIQNTLGYKASALEYEAQESNSCLWKYDLGFSISEQVFLIVPTSDYCYGATGIFFSTTLINKIIKNQIETKMKLKVYIIASEHWNRSSMMQKENIAQLVEENLISHKHNIY